VSETSPTPSAGQKKPPVHQVILGYIDQILDRLQNVDELDGGPANAAAIKSIARTLLDTLANSHFPDEVKEEIMGQLYTFERAYPDAVSTFDLSSTRHHLLL
jgi:hypothetical protein